MVAPQVNGSLWVSQLPVHGSDDACAIGQVQLSVDVLEVLVDGTRADRQAPCRLPIGQAATRCLTTWRSRVAARRVLYVCALMASIVIALIALIAIPHSAVIVQTLSAAVPAVALVTDLLLPKSPK